MIATKADITAQVATAFHLSGNYAPVTREVTGTDLPVRGRIPAALNGRYLRNGPNPRPGATSTHWFYGDGMVHGVELRDRRACWYRNRWVRTSTFTDGARLLREDLTVDRRAGVANTNLIGHAGRTLALVETSLPYEIDQQLDTIGPFDYDGRLRTAMTAHPKICPTTGELHFFGYALTPPFLTYHRADATGRLIRSMPIAVPGPTMMHDFAITATHIVFFDLPVVFDSEGAKSGMPFRWDDEYGARLGLLSRDATHDDVIWYEIEPCYVFHVLNAYDGDDGVVVDALRYRQMWRDGTSDFGGATLHRWTLSPDAPARERALDDHIAEFPRVDDRRTGLEHRYGYAIHHTEPHTGAILRYDLAGGTIEKVSVGDGRVPSEVVFAPTHPNAGETDGYLVGFVYDSRRDASELIILDAADPTASPIATVLLPQRVPFGFHGNWVPDHLETTPPSDVRRP